MKHHPVVPVWLMGLTNATFGIYGGTLVVSVPQLLSALHVPETKIALVTATVVSPGFWTFIISPVLDVRFSRRWYATVTAAVAALLLAFALLNLEHLIILQASLVAGYFFANLYQSSLGGWLASITKEQDQGRLSAWVTIGNLCGGGVMAVVTTEVMHSLPRTLAAWLLGLIVMLPLAVFPWMPAPAPARRLARDSFPLFIADVLQLLRRYDVTLPILLLILPVATFSLTNFINGVGNDFRASTQFIGVAGGTGVIVGGMLGCFSFRFIKRALPLGFLYIGIGGLGSMFTLALTLLPRTPETFACALIGENIFQALAITCSVAIAFQTMGDHDPLASTIFCVMMSAFNIPIIYMLFVDAASYERYGVTGSFVVDSGVSMIAALTLAAVFLLIAGQRGMTPRLLRKMAP